MTKKRTAVRDTIAERLSEDQLERYGEFLKDVDLHLNLSRKQHDILVSDFNDAIEYYLDNGVSFEDALSRLEPSNLGGFYAHQASTWFPLDNAAIIYLLSMRFGQMPMFRLSAYMKEEVVPQLLQMALTFTIKRFPSFATVIKAGVFWHYLDSTKKRF